MDPNNALILSTSNFAKVLDTVRGDQLSAPTPCEGWSVSDLLWHVTRGSEMAVALMNGASQTEASGFFAMEHGDDLFGQCRRALADQLNTMCAAEDFDEIVHHPMGDIPVRQLFDFRVGDLTLHAWDLARALEADEELPVDLVVHVYEALEPMTPFIGQIGVFGQGPSGAIDEEATLQVKLLDLTGRRP